MWVNRDQLVFVAMLTIIEIQHPNLLLSRQRNQYKVIVFSPLSKDSLNTYFTPTIHPTHPAKKLQKPTRKKKNPT
jgi:hypothetical protein